MKKNLLLHLITSIYIILTDERTELKQGLGFFDYQTNMVKLAKNIAKTAQDMVSFIIANLQSGSQGTQACISSAHTTSGIIDDLDTTVMFAIAGTLNANSDENFADHSISLTFETGSLYYSDEVNLYFYGESILKTAKASVEDTKIPVGGAATNQEQLANAAQMACQDNHTLGRCRVV
ncbi:talin-2-like [Mercenaria mercenaria]|uniref:talin-2-like n=1 Tax=Mercenaria mercenaria TaxID=6596 RepID=UPI00234E7D81|nr:talin-2-like [Mercenaria mercenaria]